VEMPAVGAQFKKGASAAVVDSVKAASDIYLPVSGSVTETNAALEDQPELVNTDPDTGGWLFRIKLADAGELTGLMDQAAYAAYVAEL
jgi:glycine cleavage system H protein